MFLLTPSFVAPSMDSYKIVEIDRVSNFAGKMGRENREIWKVTKGGEQFILIVMPYHTHVAKTMVFKVGDEVNVHSMARGKTIRVTLGEISK